MDWIKKHIVTDRHHAHRQTWDNPIEYWLCVLGFAVGYGSIWRFPYYVFANGGGAFVIAYLFCFFLLGIPLFYWETAIGQLAQKGIIAGYSSIHPKFKGIGLGAVISSFFVSTYYNLLLCISWIYFFYSFYYPLPWANGAEGDDAVHNVSLNTTTTFFYDNVLEKSAGIEELNGINPTIFWAFVFSLTVVFISIAKGVSITGKIAYVTAVGPYVLLLILLLRGLFLEGAGRGLAYVCTFEWGALFRFQVWYRASAQVLYQCSIVQGTLVALASYRNKNESIRRSSIGIPVITVFTGFLCMFTVFCYMGHMSHQLNVPVEELPLSGPDLVFVAYPVAVLLMPLPNLWSILFFLNLIFLGIDTQFALMEGASSYLEDEKVEIAGHKLTPVGCRAVVSLAVFVVGFVMLTRAGVYWFDFYDTYCAVGPMLLLCLCEVLVFGYHPAVERFKSQIWVETKEMVPQYFTPALKYVSPVISAFLFVYAYVHLLGKLLDLPLWTALLGVLLLLVPVAALWQAYQKHKDDDFAVEETYTKPLIELNDVRGSETKPQIELNNVKVVNTYA